MISVVNDTFLAKMEHNPESGRVKSRNQFFTRSADGGSTRRRPLLRLPTLEVPTTWALPMSEGGAMGAAVFFQRDSRPLFDTFCLEKFFPSTKKWNKTQPTSGQTSYTFGMKTLFCPFFREGIQIQFSPFGKFRTGRAFFFGQPLIFLQIGSRKCVCVCVCDCLCTCVRARVKRGKRVRQREREKRVYRVCTCE